MTEYQSNNVLVNEKDSSPKKSSYYRSLVAYWLLGLTNNYGYVVMLTAADDIIRDSRPSEPTHGPRNCKYMSTGAILLADIIPALTVKLLAPYFPFFVNLRMLIITLSAAGGFIIVAFSESITISIMGVALTSFCSGLGEVTLLQYSTFHDKNVISSWSSGTGGAGVIGAVSYTLLTAMGLKQTLLVMLVVPLTMAISFWIILPSPNTENIKHLEIQRQVNSEEVERPLDALSKKLKLVPGLLKYMIPLGTVYIFEYFINQGTFELIKINNDFVSVDKQYHWLQVTYQVGVFISRSSVNIFHIKNIWVLSVLQLLNVAIYTTEAIFIYIPYFWIVIAFTLWEGLLGGAAYVNTFYRVSSEVREEDKQFSMATTSFADSIGITIAGLLAIFEIGRAHV